MLGASCHGAALRQSSKLRIREPSVAQRLLNAAGNLRLTRLISTKGSGGPLTSLGFSGSSNQQQKNRQRKNPKHPSEFDIHHHCFASPPTLTPIKHRKRQRQEPQ